MTKFKVALMKGVKHSDGKARFDLIPPLPLIEVAHVYSVGAEKYEDRNWEKGVPWCKYFAAMQRHMQAWLAGEDCDEESGLHHMAHAAWGCLTLIEYARTHPELDDRTQYKVEKVSTVYKGASKQECSGGSAMRAHREAALRAMNDGEGRKADPIFYKAGLDHMRDRAKQALQVIEAMLKEERPRNAVIDMKCDRCNSAVVVFQDPKGVIGPGIVPCPVCKESTLKRVTK